MSKADGLKHAETEPLLFRKAVRGGEPRSIRKRGFHRALKRGEIWARLEHGDELLRQTLSRELFGKLIFDPDCPPNTVYMFSGLQISKIENLD